MPKKRIKQIRRRTQRKKTNSRSWMFVVFIPIIAITIFALVQPQRAIQFAQTIYKSPPLFGCLQVGEGSSTDCASKLGGVSTFSLAINGKQIPADDENEQMYINDKLTASYSFKSTGDLPIDIKNYGVAAGSLEQLYVLPFTPLEGKKTLAPGQSISGSNLTFTLTGQDIPAGKWIAGPGVTNTKGTPIPIDPQYSRKFVVNPSCTALRVKPLTDEDKKNIQSLCKKDPNNTLCKSKQYCQIFNGGKCDQPEASPAVPTAECNEKIVLAKGEQDILEQLCKTFPGTPACKDFCKRSIGAKICPPVVLWFDKSEKQVFPKPAKYMAAANTPSIAEQQDHWYDAVKNIVGIVFAQAPPPPGPAPPPPAGATNVGGVNIPNWPPPAPPPGGGAPVGAGSRGCPPGQVENGPDCVNPGGSSGGPAPAASVNNPLAPRPAGPGVDPRASNGFTAAPSCASHRQNDSGECCVSDLPLINNCCQPGCFVYHHENLSTANCPFKDKGGTCCAQDVVVQAGFCQANEVPPGNVKTPNIPRDPAIFPPNVPQIDPGTPPSVGGVPAGQAPAVPDSQLHPPLNGTPWNNDWNSDQKEAACRAAGGRYTVSDPNECIPPPPPAQPAPPTKFDICGAKGGKIDPNTNQCVGATDGATCLPGTTWNQGLQQCTWPTETQTDKDARCAQSAAKYDPGSDSCQQIAGTKESCAAQNYDWDPRGYCKATNTQPAK